MGLDRSRPNGSWVRLYPVPFSRLDQKQQYRKFDWIECELVKSTKDPRPETHHPCDMELIKPVDHMGTVDNWRERREFLFSKVKVHSAIEQLIGDAKANLLSLALFKPTHVLDFFWEEDTRQWDERKLAEMRNMAKQGELFDKEAWRKTFRIIPKLPYSFSYRFADADGRQSEMQVLDWETGALFWSCVRRHRNEQVALKKVREKYYDEFTRTNLHFILGTTLSFHFRAPNPWVIVGVLPIPIPDERQLNLL